MAIVLPDPGPPNPDFERPADHDRLERTAAALRARGFKARVADSAEHARELVLEAVPKGAEVHTALSETLTELGLRGAIDESGDYDSIRKRLNALDRKTQFKEMRKLAAAPDYALGSAAAVTDDGDIIVASGSGSQLGGYAYAGGNVILVIGHQKLVRDIDEGLRRIREYSLPREFQRMQSVGYAGTVHAKTLILHREPSGRTTVILVPQTLGF